MLVKRLTMPALMRGPSSGLSMEVPRVIAKGSYEAVKHHWLVVGVGHVVRTHNVIPNGDLESVSDFKARAFRLRLVAVSRNTLGRDRFFCEWRIGFGAVVLGGAADKWVVQAHGRCRASPSVDQPFGFEEIERLSHRPFVMYAETSRRSPLGSATACPEPASEPSI